MPLLANPHQSTTNANSHQASEYGSQNWSILVHSHLRWDWVWQRPQQFLSRLSSEHPVVFVEEPVSVEDLTDPQWTLTKATDAPNVHIIQVELPALYFQDRATVDKAHRREVLSALSHPAIRSLLSNFIQWFYDPMAAPLFAGKLGEMAVVYDCMDQLSQFRGAPAELVRREQELLKIADVVFAGGPKIHQKKKQSNMNCHCFGCGVDSNHFGTARLDSTIVPSDISHLKSPILGFFGVVDERMDYHLIEALAKHREDWEIVIIGPATKVDPSSLPRRANLHWLGARDYFQLPGYVKAFDICLMPFAINSATEYINPTKALEYMAAERPIVSTAIEDVVLQFSDVVHLASSQEDFIAVCERVLAFPPKPRIASGRMLAASNSWEAIVERMEMHINAAVAKTETAAA